MGDSSKGNTVGADEASSRAGEAGVIVERNGASNAVPIADEVNTSSADVADNPTTDVANKPAADVANKSSTDLANKSAADVADKLAASIANKPAADVDKAGVANKNATGIANNPAAGIATPAANPDSPSPNRPGLAAKWMPHLGPHEQLLAYLILILFISASFSGSLSGLLLLDTCLFLLLWKSANIIFNRTDPWYRIYVAAALFSSIVDACLTIISYQTMPLAGAAKGMANAVLAHVDGHTISTIVLDAISTFGFAALLVVSICKLFVGLTKVRTVTRDTIFGGIYVYLLLAFLWDLVYLYIAVWYPDSFKFPNPERGQYDLMYFSLNTITTLGHGDIVPTQPLTMVLCNLEALVGQIFPCVFIARLVSLYVIQEMEKRKEPT